MRLPPLAFAFRSAFSIMACLACSALSGESVLTNPDLKLDQTTNSVSGWQYSPKSTGFTVETKDVPDGASFALRVKVTDASPGSGELTQRLTMPSDASKLVLTGYMKSDLPRAGYIEVKLYQGKRELVRMNGGVLSDSNWQKVIINIDPQVVTKQGDIITADKMEVLCRWYRQEKHLGASVLFAKLELVETGSTVAVMGGSTATETGSTKKHGWGLMLSDFFRPEVSVINIPLPDITSSEAARRQAWTKCLANKPNVVLLQCDWRGLGAVNPDERSALVQKQITENIQTAKDAGVPLILVTPPARRLFDESGHLIDEFSAQLAMLREIAAAQSVPVIDLYAQSSGRLGQLGSEASTALFCSIKDRANFSKQGARLMAALVVESLAIQKPNTVALLDVAAIRNAL